MRFSHADRSFSGKRLFLYHVTFSNKFREAVPPQIFWVIDLQSKTGHKDMWHSGPPEQYVLKLFQDSLPGFFVLSVFPSHADHPGVAVIFSSISHCLPWHTLSMSFIKRKNRIYRISPPECRGKLLQRSWTSCLTTTLRSSSQMCPCDRPSSP